MPGLLENVFLGERVNDLILSDDDLLFENLDRVQPICGFLAAQDHLAEGSLSQNLDEFKVLQRLKNGANVLPNSKSECHGSQFKSYFTIAHHFAPACAPAAEHVDV